MLKWLGGLVDSNEKQVQRLRGLVEDINGFEADYEKLSAEELKNKTAEFKKYLAEAAADHIRRQEEKTKELEAIHQKLAQTSDGVETDELNAQAKRLDDELGHIREDLRHAQQDALDDLLPEAFAAVREAAKRTIGQRHFDMQLLGGMVLHQGKIAEMKTGEGKTLAATLPLYLNSLTGEGCHLVTVNDYLSKRDAKWMGAVYNALGVTVGSIHGQTADNMSPSFVYDPTYESADKRWNYLRPVARREAYLADITYGTNNEFGFDYLRDNMVLDLSQCVQRPLNYAIVDEVDNLLIDEARTPLIISGPGMIDAEQFYVAVDNVVRSMKMATVSHEAVTPEEKDKEEQLEADYDFIAYEKTHNIRETPRGQERLARAFGMKADDLFGEREDLMPQEATRRDVILSIFRQSMMAHAWYKKDTQYVIKDGEVIIVDEFTGRLMFGRRYSEGLHQAIEAKERVKVQRESMTYATVTFQNYFRMYRKLAGMTGTALTEAEEFHKIYNLEVVVIPTNKPMVRKDEADRIYKDEPSKFNAVGKEVTELHEKRRPILIGTVSIEKSEMLSDLLKRKGITARVLNAKPDRAQQEADIIAQAGRLGAVTVATNMAGRGVDIILGGNPEGRDPADWQKEHDAVVALGGLHIIGTERHEARRIDNQLRGRAGRQGDPGSSRFFVSLDDDIIKRFGGDRIRGLMNFAGMDEDTPIENRLINRTIEGAQVRTEGYHFDVRKHLVEFDDVVNTQRELIYAERQKILGGADLKSNILAWVEAELCQLVARRAGSEQGDGRDLSKLLTETASIVPLPADFNTDTVASLKPSEIQDRLIEIAHASYDRREKEFGPEIMRRLEREVIVPIIDGLWIRHLTVMEERRQQASWAGLKQVKAVDEYKRLGGSEWDELTRNIQSQVAHVIFHVGVKQEAVRQTTREPAQSPMAKVNAPRAKANAQPAANGSKKIGRNDPCPCGSGKKYKHCHGR